MSRAIRPEARAGRGSHRSTAIGPEGTPGRSEAARMGLRRRRPVEAVDPSRHRTASLEPMKPLLPAEAAAADEALGVATLVTGRRLRRCEFLGALELSCSVRVVWACRDLFCATRGDVSEHTLVCQLRATVDRPVSRCLRDGQLTEFLRRRRAC